MSHTQIVPFHSQELLTIEVNGECHIAMRPIIDGMGLSWPGQYHKLLSQKEKFSCHHMVTTGADGKQYEMLCIPQHKLPGWLLGISLAKVKSAIREAVVQYQQECFDVLLYQYWMQRPPRQFAIFS